MGMHVKSSVFLFLAFIVFLAQVCISVFTVTKWFDMKHSKLLKPKERTLQMIGLVLMVVSLIYNAILGSFMQKRASRSGFFSQSSELNERRMRAVASSLLGFWLALFFLSLLFASDYFWNIGCLLLTNAAVTGILLLHIRAIGYERPSDVPSIKSGQSVSSLGIPPA